MVVRNYFLSSVEEIDNKMILLKGPTCCLVCPLQLLQFRFVITNRRRESGLTAGVDYVSRWRKLLTTCSVFAVVFQEVKLCLENIFTFWVLFICLDLYSIKNLRSQTLNSLSAQCFFSKIILFRTKYITQFRCDIKYLTLDESLVILRYLN